MESILLLLQILMINLVLSGDNAVVIAMASKNLPLSQRKKAVWWGAIGAVLLRCLLTWVALLLLQIPFIQACGGILLAFIAYKLLTQQEDETRVESAATLWKSIRTILFADLIMSLDNVLAIAAVAQGDVAILVIGIAIGIPIVVWGSNLIADLLRRFPVLVYAGAAILAYTAGKMLLHDPKLGGLLKSLVPEAVHWLPGALSAAIVIIGLMRQKYFRSA
ncbi:TerC family protein [Paenibacillus physcomitrellae]|uniref:Membrane protein n=1 Tax=Paenibacillus physcomitrellae TaxID=1619311 RepID=A0ABQ1FL00_9BACL|nr:TerC family protein [Paenibacillus physcomitrellae]GGA20649.1 membrane protein [Paenibacillus physcomitrellae]